jgi:peptidyl-tRNA hydrolase
MNKTEISNDFMNYRLQASQTSLSKYNNYMDRTGNSVDEIIVPFYLQVEICACLFTKKTPLITWGKIHVRKNPGNAGKRPLAPVSFYC